jgi:hypothetical protein
MVITTLLSTLLSTFATPVPDLCADVVRDASGAPVTDAVGQTLSRFCQWTGPGAPVWDANVCCTFDADTAACSKVGTRGCPSGTATRYCKHGKADALGGVTCYQPVPSMCDAGLCIDAPAALPTAQATDFVACCENGGQCHLIENDAMIQACEGGFLWCEYGMSNADGTVECYG